MSRKEMSFVVACFLNTGNYPCIAVNTKYVEEDLIRATSSVQKDFLCEKLTFLTKHSKIYPKFI